MLWKTFVHFEDEFRMPEFDIYGFGEWKTVLIHTNIKQGINYKIKTILKKKKYKCWIANMLWRAVVGE